MAGCCTAQVSCACGTRCINFIDDSPVDPRENRRKRGRSLKQSAGQRRSRESNNERCSPRQSKCHAPAFYQRRSYLVAGAVIAHTAVGTRSVDVRNLGSSCRPVVRIRTNAKSCAPGDLHNATWTARQSWAPRLSARATFRQFDGPRGLVTAVRTASQGGGFSSMQRAALS